MENQTNQMIGRRGETIARKYLNSRGFRITDANFPTPFGEIDLIAKKEGYTVCVEVKTRTSERFGSPFSGITRHKKNTIIRNFFFYLKLKGLYDTPCRIDVIAIDLGTDGKARKLEHITNAVSCSGSIYK